MVGFAGGDGDGGGGSDHLNRCLRVKAAFAESVKFPANEAFSARAVIPPAVVWLWGEWWEWWAWWEWSEWWKLWWRRCKEKSSLVARFVW